MVNGESLDVDAATLADLVRLLGHEHAAVATAVNGTFVPRTERASWQLEGADRIEIVSPRQGG